MNYTYRIGNVLPGAYRALNEDTVVMDNANPRNAVSKWASVLPSGAIEEGDTVVIYRVEDGALFLLPVKRARVVELELG